MLLCLIQNSVLLKNFNVIADCHIPRYNKYYALLFSIYFEPAGLYNITAKTFWLLFTTRTLFLNNSHYQRDYITK